MSIKMSLKQIQQAAHALALVLVIAIPLVLWLGGAQPLAVGLLRTPWDKLAHMAVFALLSCAIGYASRYRGVQAMLVGFVGAVLVGLVDEAHQMRLPGRSADADDLVANAVGALLGTVVLAVRIRLREWVAARTGDMA